MKNQEIFDVIVVGAGLSGIDAAYHLQTKCPQKSYTILESRDQVGGTWDLFRYPGVRSDSDVETLGFPFRKWTHEKSIVDGKSIRDYIESTAKEFKIYENIRFRWKVLKARWSSKDLMWTLTCLNPSQETTSLHCRFFFSCTGYYNYAEGYQPEWPGLKNYQGRFIHPQFWPESYEIKDKNIVIIGSGATAITLLPTLAQTAASVTMVQRSPTYIASRPSIDKVSSVIRSVLPAKIAHHIIRLKNILYGVVIYQFAKVQPELTKKIILKLAARKLPSTIDLKKDFTPRYRPWDQRLCVAPDGDFFAAIRKGNAKIVTDEIDSFTENGLRLRSGTQLHADTIISATGLKLALVGDIRIFVDDQEVDFSQRMSYKGLMLSDIPNFALAIGYTNASWTLKCDLSSQYICRLLNYMEKHRYQAAWPVVNDPSLKRETLLDLSSGYIKRSESLLPKQGSQKPWKLYQNFFLDWLTFRFSPINDGHMNFVRK